MDIKEPYWYLATPYTKFGDGLEEAFIESCKAAGRLITRGLRVYSPIAHCHPIAEHAGIDKLDHEIWLPAQAPMMHNACGLIVCMMEGWQESYGVTQEIKLFNNLHKPIVYMNWPDD